VNWNLFSLNCSWNNTINLYLELNSDDYFSSCMIYKIDDFLSEMTNFLHMIYKIDVNFIRVMLKWKLILS